jgi:hypothetical protein
VKQVQAEMAKKEESEVIDLLSDTDDQEVDPSPPIKAVEVNVKTKAKVTKTKPVQARGKKAPKIKLNDDEMQDPDEEENHGESSPFLEKSWIGAIVDGKLIVDLLRAFFFQIRSTSRLHYRNNDMLREGHRGYRGSLRKTLAWISNVSTVFVCLWFRHLLCMAG